MIFSHEIIGQKVVHLLLLYSSNAVPSGLCSPSRIDPTCFLTNTHFPSFPSKSMPLFIVVSALILDISRPNILPLSLSFALVQILNKLIWITHTPLLILSQILSVTVSYAL